MPEKRSAGSYGEYLKVPELLSLQRTLSEPLHHDETLFIIIHQVYELWFKQMLHEMDAVVRYLMAGDTHFATRLVRRLIEIQRVLIQQVSILETMTPPDFMQFRDHLNPASGFQSYQFRALEFRSGLKEPRFVEMHRADPHAVRMLQKALGAPSLRDAWEMHLRERGLDYPPLDDSATAASADNAADADTSAIARGAAAAGATSTAAPDTGASVRGVTAKGAGDTGATVAGAASTGAAGTGVAGTGSPASAAKGATGGAATGPAATTPGTPHSAASNVGVSAAREDTMKKRMLSLLKIYEDRGSLYDLYILAEALIEYDENFLLWRQHHILMVERMIGMKQGTGGSEGVGYLRTTLGRKCFPDLWEVRTHISRDVVYGQ